MPAPPWKILPLLRSLMEQEEVEAFRLWMQEKARVSENYVSVLFESLVEVLTRQEEEGLDGPLCWALIRPEDPYDKESSDNQLRQYRSELKDKVERFILEKALEQPDNEWVRLLTFQELSRRGLHGLLEKAYKQELDRWKGKEVIDLTDLYFLFEAETMRNQHNAMGTRIKSTHLSDVIDRFIEYVLPMYLKMACANLSENAILPNQYQPIFLEELLAMLKEKDLQPKDGLLYVYAYLYRFLDGRTEEIAPLLHTLRPENTTLSKDELIEIYGLLQNGITRRANQGGFTKWGPKLLELFHWGLEVKALLEEGALNPRNYKNIVITALRLDRRQEAWDLIEDLRPYLPAGAGEYYRFCKGYYFYTTREYEKIKGPDAWDPRLPFQNTVLRISADLIGLQADYEQHWGTGEEEEIFQLREQIQTLTRFIKSQKSISEGNKASWLLRLSFFKRLLRKMDRKALEAFYQEIQTTPLLSNREWFLYQIRWRLEMEG